MSAVEAPLISEADHQRHVLELATILGWHSMHVRKAMGSKKHGWVTPTSLSGWPDATLWHPVQRRLIFVEFKSEKGRLTAEQVAVIVSLRAAGQEVYVWRPSDLDGAHFVLSGKPHTIEVYGGGDQWRTCCPCGWSSPLVADRSTAVQAAESHASPPGHPVRAS